MKIVHAHDQARTAQNLVRIGSERGQPWYRIPPVYAGKPEIVVILAKYRRLGSLVSYLYSTFAELLARFVTWWIGGVLHIHGGHLHKFCRRTRLPYVLHIHGSEVRGFDAKGLAFSRVSNEIRAAILKAKAVAYSTPELGPILEEFYEGAVWVPSPVGNVPMRAEEPSFEFADIFFPHVWMGDKSLDLLVPFIESLRASYSGAIRLVGLDIGDRTDIAKSLGFELVKVADAGEHVRRMLNSKVVLAQPHGAALGVSDLQAVVSGANFVPFPLQVAAQKAYGYGESDQLSESFEETKRITLELLQNPHVGNKLNLRNIANKHSDDFIYSQLERLYSQL